MEKLKKAVIREELVALTGNSVKALILNQLIEEEKRENDWFSKSAKELTEEILLTLNPFTIRRHLESLVAKGWIDERQNPKYKWDRTKQYRVNLHKIQQDLAKLGYSLQDYR